MTYIEIQAVFCNGEDERMPFKKRLVWGELSCMEVERNDAMNSLVLAVLMMVGYFVAYHTYGKFLARKIFKLNPEAVCPSTALQDNHDFVPTKKEILFGHHFTSIAGLGPIVGPAIAIIWGWVPAVLWVFFGSIFFGAVHDFGALVISLRADGRSIGDLAADIINKRVRTLFLLIIFFGLWIVIAVFALSKQCDTETSSLFIGYGSMLMEGTLATLVIVAVAAGIGIGLAGKGGEILRGADAFNHHYASWGAAAGLGSKLGAFVTGSANMIQSYGIPVKIALAVMSVFIVSFAATTVDTATRIQRYVVVELSNACNFKLLSRRQAGTIFAVITAGILAFYDGSGKGAMKLWPLFGSINQLLAGLALLVATIYLARRKVNIAYTGIPMVFMIIITGWAMVLNIRNFYNDSNWLLFVIGLAVFVLEIWMIIESVIVLKTVYDKETDLPETVT